VNYICYFRGRFGTSYLKIWIITRLDGFNSRLIIIIIIIIIIVLLTANG